VSRPAHLALLRVAPPGVAPFVLAAQTAGDRYFAPYVAEHAVWEPAESLCLARMLGPGMHVLDVGAHLGYYSLLCARRVGPRGSVLAVEPEPENFRLLQANLLLNDVRNVIARRLAAADARGRAALHLSDDNFGDHRLQAVAGRRRVDVETMSLDEALAGALPDFVKIDTQGAEPRVLMGMAQTLARARGELGMLMEFAPGLLARGGLGVAAFADLLAGFGACAYRALLHEDRVRLRALRPLAASLESLAEELAGWGEEDASLDLFLFFSATAEARWIARFRDAAA
jgi:FkbM family methyltransferase